MPRLPLTLTLIAATVLSAGCARVAGRQGFIIDQQLAGAVRAGVDNKASVQASLGRPTFVGQFDGNDWYYVSRETRQWAFSRPSPSAQTLLHIRFDAAGNVTTVENKGLEQVASIRPNSDKTPTLGKQRSFFQEIFGNIGQVGSVGQGGGTADNPDGN
jgi:outer membrane protein assembly factor BamE (lipoprotein component of BamABCDE complex)